MKKNIDIDNSLVTKLKILAVFEEMSVKALMEKAVAFYVEHKEKERFERLSDEEKEDIGLFMLMQQLDNDLNDTVSLEEAMKSLEE